MGGGGGGSVKKDTLLKDTLKNLGKKTLGLSLETHCLSIFHNIHRSVC